MGKLPVMQCAKYCANCAYWGGERTINGFFGRAEVSDDCHAKGVCSNMKGYINQQMHWQATCPAFTRHPAIKG
jgi:hypothetical protein